MCNHKIAKVGEDECSFGSALVAILRCLCAFQWEGLHYIPLVSVSSKVINNILGEVWLVSMLRVGVLSSLLKFNKVFDCRHMQQPIYWPDKLPDNPNTYQKAYDSLKLKSSQGNHPQDNIDDIFGKGIIII